MREVPLKLEKYGVSRALYEELKWFCRQYGDKRREIAALRGGSNCFGLDGMPRDPSPGNPTQRRAMRCLMLAGEMRAIEECARLASPELWEYLLRHVTQGVKYEHLGVPCGLRQFKEARQRFYVLLARRLDKLGPTGAVEGW